MTQAVKSTMAATIRASEQGLDLVEQKRCLKGWAKSCKVWADLANTTPSTLRRFWAKDAIQASAFKSICTTVGIEDWESIVASESEATHVIEWPATERLRLLQTLNAFPADQFPMLVCALNPPQGTIPEEGSDSHRQRCQALFDWAASPTGQGLDILDDLLSTAIAKRTAISSKFIGFAVSGTVNDKTAPEVQAIIELLKRTVGNSLEVVFYEEGSINIILSGSVEDLRKLQALYESGELSNLAIPTIQRIDKLADDTPISRKARLVTALKFHVKMRDLSNYSQRVQILSSNLNSALSRARALSRESDLNRNPNIDLISVIFRALDSALAGDFDSVLNPDITLDLDRDLASTLTLTSDFARDLARDLASTLDLDLEHDLASTLTSARTRALDLASDLDRVLANDRARTFSRDRARALASSRALALARALALIIDNTSALASDLASASDLCPNLASDLNLTDANLQGANLRNLNLVGINLTNADLTNADVVGTVFGDNEGLSESTKRDLERRGAIVKDSPGSDIPIPGIP